MIVNTFYSATRRKTNGVLTKNSSDNAAYLYCSPSIAMMHCCDPDGVNVSMRTYEGALYVIEQKSSVAQLAMQGFNALKRDIYLYKYIYETWDKAIDEDGKIGIRFDYPRGELVGTYNAFDYIGADQQVARMISVEDRRESSAYDFLFTPSAMDRKEDNPSFFPLFSFF